MKSIIILIIVGIGIIIYSSSRSNDGLTEAQISAKTCKSNIATSDMMTKGALRSYDEGDYVEGRKKLEHARDYLIIGFKHCSGLPEQDELIRKSELLSKALNDKGLKIKSNIQKLIKGDK